MTLPKEGLQYPFGKQSSVIVDVPDEEDEEQKSTIFGASCNLINAIIGAAIVGIPYAMKQTGLGSGLIMIVVCAILTEKSLRLLIDTAKHVGVSTYELLLESCFGRVGFILISLNMLIMSYGALVGYLLVIKDTLPILMGISPTNDTMKKVILTVTSLLICLPLSSQRDVAHLAKTSKISVLLDVILVNTGSPPFWMITSSEKRTFAPSKRCLLLYSLYPQLASPIHTFRYQ
jgi:sodium-coupled neutral amino acid transporter 11